jgi:hypothetical protein
MMQGPSILSDATRAGEKDACLLDRHPPQTTHRPYFLCRLRKVNLLRVTITSLDGLSQKALPHLGQNRGFPSLRGFQT